MATTQVNGCFGQYAACGGRVARLGPGCCPVPGDNNGVAFKCLSTLTASPEREEGTEYSCKDGCGTVCWVVKDCDREKRMNIDMELCVRDLEMLEIVTSATMDYDAAGNAVGIQRQGPQAPCPSGATLEVWAKVGTSAGQCPPDPASVTPTPGWWRYSYGRVFLSMGDSSLGDDSSMVALSGYAEVNPCFRDGPWNDYPGLEGVGPDTLESITLDVAGPPEDIGCGYVEVPDQTGALDPVLA